MLKSIRYLHSVLNREKILYCHWKSNEHLQEALNGDTDLDMIFDLSQRRDIEIILNHCGLKRFRATPHMQYNAIEDYIGFDKESAKIWHLHLHYRLTLGEKHLKGYTVPWTSYILENRVYDNEFGVFRSRSEDEYFLILLRISLKLRWRDYNRKLGSDDLTELKWLKERAVDENVEKIANKLLGEKVAKEYRRLLVTDIRSKKDFYNLQKKLRKSMKHFTAYTRIISFLRRSMREFFWILSGFSRKFGFSTSTPKRRVSPSGGAVVAILGCDGAGKSTTLSYLYKEFSKKIDIKCVYLGSGDGSSSILRLSMKIFAKKLGGKGLRKSIQSTNTQSQAPVKVKIKIKLYKTAKIIWAITLVLEKKRKLVQITRARNNGILVLTDRYPQIEIMGYNDGPLMAEYLSCKSKLLSKIANWELNMYKRAYINPPDLVIKLMVPTTIALERKPEMTMQEIEDKKAAVRKINLSINSYEIDTSKDKISSFGEVMEKVWEII